MNILKIQDSLKNFSQQQLVTEIRTPSGNVPQFLVLSELSRRKRMQTDQARAEAADTPTVAQEAVAAAGMPMGGVTQMAQAMAPKTSMAENTGIAAMMPKQPTRMADGGVVKMQTAGKPKDALEELNKQAVAELKRLYPEVYEQYKDKPRELLYIARQMVEVAKDPKLTGLEETEKPRTNFEKFKDFAGYSQLKANNNMEKIEKGNKEREIADQIATKNALTRYFDGGDTRIPTIFDNPIFAEGAPTEYLKGTSGGGFPRKLSQVDSPMIATPSMGLGDLSSSNVNAPNSTQDPYTGNRSIPEAMRLSTSFLKPSAAEAPDLSAIPEDVAQDDVLKALADPYHMNYGATDLIDKINFRGDNPFLGGSQKNLNRLKDSILNPDFEGTPHPNYSQGFLEGALSGRYTGNPAMGDVNRRAVDFLKSDTSTPREEIYSDYLGGDARAIARYQEESPETIQAISDRLAKEAAADEEAKIKQQFGGADAEAQAQRDAEIAAQAAMVEEESKPKTYFDQAADYMRQALEAERAMGLNLTSLPSTVGGYFDDFTTYAADKVNDYQEAQRNKESEKIELNEERQAAAEKQAEDLLNQFQSSSDAANKQASAANMSLAEYVKGLDKDRESSKWLAVARMGAELMKPSATIGEGIGKAVSVGAKDLQEGKKAYNKSKLTVLGLQARIDAAKAKSGALTTNQRLTQGLKFQEAASDLREKAMLTKPVDLAMLERAKGFEITAQRLLGMPSMTQSNVVKAPSAT